MSRFYRSSWEHKFKEIPEGEGVPTVFGHTFLRLNWQAIWDLPTSPFCARCSRHILDHERIENRLPDRVLLDRERRKALRTARRPNRRDRRSPSKPGRR